MRRPRAPLYLGRAAYRRRRLHDAARLLPLFGLFLIGLPLLWPTDTAAVPPPAARDVVWLFAVWAGLIATAAALAPGLGAGAPRDEGGVGGSQTPEGMPFDDRAGDPARSPADVAAPAPAGQGG